jgi:hypothetical protein
MKVGERFDNTLKLTLDLFIALFLLITLGILFFNLTTWSATKINGPSILEKVSEPQIQKSKSYHQTPTIYSKEDEPRNEIK